MNSVNEILLRLSKLLAAGIVGTIIYIIAVGPLNAAPSFELAALCWISAGVAVAPGREQPHLGVSARPRVRRQPLHEARLTLGSDPHIIPPRALVRRFRKDRRRAGRLGTSGLTVMWAIPHH